MPLNPPKIPEGCVEACGACGLRSFSSKESEDFYISRVSKLLPIESIFRAPESKRWGYREKVLLHAQREKNQWRFGLLKRKGREKEFIWIPECPVHHSSINQVVVPWAASLPEIPLRFLSVSGKIITLVLKEKRREAALNLLQESAKSLGPDWALWVNWNPSAGNRVFDSKRFEWICGPKEMRSDGFLYGPSTFRQQIGELQRESLKMVTDFFSPLPVVDFYSGLGVSCALWRQKDIPVLGLELGGESLSMAQRNAPGVDFLRGRVEDRLPQVDEWLKGIRFNLYVNPPRGGLHPLVMEWILARKPDHFAYLSCNPKTLRRDLDLCKGHYELELVQPFEFFPQTTHIENLALLRRI